jgi:hypothetical protein
MFDEVPGESIMAADYRKKSHSSSSSSEKLVTHQKSNSLASYSSE